MGRAEWCQCRIQRKAFKQFRVQLAQRLPIVDVVPYRQTMHVEADFARTVERLACDSLGAPVDVVEQTPMRLLNA